MKQILIYNDEGVDQFGATSLTFSLQQEQLHKTYRIAHVDREILKKEEWITDTRLLIIPGGRDIPYHQALEGTGNRNIKEFVSRGGSFLGICAGGYYGSGAVDFERGGPLEVLADRELKFFPGIACGPAYGLGTFHYRSQQGARIAHLHLHQRDKALPVAAYYNGGCFFANAEEHENVSVLARYEDIEDQPAAIVKCRVGEGQAVLSGVHPEYSAYHHGVEKYLRLFSHFSELKKSEEMRRTLFRTIFMQLKVVGKSDFP